MKNIITGAHGFLGSNLIKKLDGETLAIKHEDIRSIKLLPFEYGYFLSSYGNIIDQTDTQSIMQANVLDLIHILNQSVQYNFKSFVFISTSSVKLRTQTMYSRSKRAAEEVLLSYMEKYNKPICIIRPYTITGVSDNPKHLIPVLIDSCMTGKLVNLVPNATHDYIDVEDVVDGIINLSEHQARGIYELGTGTSYSNSQILALVEKVTGKKANVNLVNNLRPYDNEYWVSTNYRSRGYGWAPKRTVADSIKSMVENYVK